MKEQRKKNKWGIKTSLEYIEESDLEYFIYEHNIEMGGVV